MTNATSAAGRPPFFSSAVRLIVSSLNSLVHFGLMIFVSPFSHSAVWAIYRHWARTACWIFGITIAKSDDNADIGPRPHLYVWLNQTSLVEIVTHPALPPLHKIANVEYALMPVVGWTCWPLRDIVIVRQWKQQSKRGIERAARRLARGETWAISIEGARSPDGRLLPYKKGPVVMAIQAQATIVPIVIKGAHDVMPHGEWRIRPGHIELRLLKAVPTRGLTYDDRDAVFHQLRQLAERELVLFES